MTTTTTRASILKALLTLLLAFGLTFALPAFAASGPNNPTADHDNPSSCLGAERATRNSHGGDRDHGRFGPAQSDFVKAQKPYGQWLKAWKEDCLSDDPAPTPSPSSK